MSVTSHRRLFDESIPQLVIVGIGYPVGVYWNSIPHRSLDLTPTKDAAWEAETEARYPKPLGSGGGLDFLRFIIVSIISRGARFFAVATAFHFFGQEVKDVILKNVNLFSVVFIVLLIGGFWIMSRVGKKIAQ